ncbi:hypothetical protein HMPREF9347_00882 [Escherichia coli MS 124-1]|nr:hypothetical protein HMPREF9347_00882 [Escherichia coli MS 124-1]
MRDGNVNTFELIHASLFLYKQVGKFTEQFTSKRQINAIMLYISL